jgi:predicted SnoaL-like aldol condensation-catalyzing enzyme
LVLDGRAAVRERFGRLFATAPRVHATVDARMTRGDFVVWQETATGMPGGKTNTAIFVWEVHDGQITRVLIIP